jgi:SAM-dependent methyltransferase
LIVKRLREYEHNFNSYLLDIGGGQKPQYKPLLKPLAKKYINLEIVKGPGVDIVGSIYDIPMKDSSVDVATMFMVLEHLHDPLKGLQEASRVLKKGGYLGLTTVQYWHEHAHPSDFFRYTRFGLRYLLRTAGFRIVKMWSIGGPFLVVFHAIELNLPSVWRTIFSILFYRLFDWLDWIVYKHNDTRENPDSVGWSLIAQKK